MCGEYVIPPNTHMFVYPNFLEEIPRKYPHSQHTHNTHASPYMCKQRDWKTQTSNGREHTLPINVHVYVYPNFPWIIPKEYVWYFLNGGD